MKAPKNSLTGDAGEHIVSGEFVSQLGWGVSQNSKSDLGTDLWVMTRDVSGVDLGALVGV